MERLKTLSRGVASAILWPLALARELLNLVALSVRWLAVYLKVVVIAKVGRSSSMDSSGLVSYFTVNVPKGSLANAIKTSKCWVDGHINEKNFSPTTSRYGDIEVVLFHFNHVISTDDAIVEMAERGCRPASPQEILAFGDEYPEPEREYPIVALGDLWCEPFSGRYATELRWRKFGSEDRSLGLHSCDNGWDPHYRFLAVCNE